MTPHVATIVPSTLLPPEPPGVYFEWQLSNPCSEAHIVTAIKQDICCFANI